MTTTYRRDDITLLLIGLLAFYNAFLSILGPLMPYLRDDLDLSYTVGSLHFSAIAAGMMTGGWVGDRAVRRLGRRNSAWIGSIGICAGAFALAIGQNPVVTIASVYLLMGCVGSLALIVIGSSLSDHHGPNRTLAIAEANIAASFGAGVGPLAIGAAVAIGAGWRWALLVPIVWLALLGMKFRGASFPTMTGLPIEAKSDGPLPAAYWAYWATVTVVVGVEFGLIYFGADFLDKVAGLSRDAATTTMSLFLWGMFTGRIIGRSLNKAHASRVLPGALGVTAIGFAIYWIAPTPVFSVVGLFISGLGVANLYPLASALAFDAAPSQSNAAGGARLSFASGSAILVAPLVLGVLADLVGLRAGYLVVPVLIVAAIVLSRLGSRLAQNEIVSSHLARNLA